MSNWQNKKRWNSYITEDIKKKTLETIKKRKEAREKKQKEDDEIEKKLKVLREKHSLEENISLKVEDISQNTTDISQNTTDISQNTTDISQNTMDISQNISLSDKLPYLLIDYNDKNINFADEYEYNTLLIDKKHGISNVNIDDIDNKIKNNKYIIINFWRILTKSNLNNISYDCADIDYKKFVNLFEKKYKWGIKEKPSDDLTREEINNYELIYDNVLEIIKHIYNHGKKIFIISNAHYSFIQNILKYYKLDKYIEKIITPSMCGISYVYNSGKEVIQDSRKINIERFFIYIERYIGRLAR
jgi:hypothetical protein